VGAGEFAFDALDLLIEAAAKLREVGEDFAEGVLGALEVFITGHAQAVLFGDAFGHAITAAQQRQAQFVGAVTAGLAEQRSAALFEVHAVDRVVLGLEQRGVEARQSLQETFAFIPLHVVQPVFEMDRQQFGEFVRFEVTGHGIGARRAIPRRCAKRQDHAHEGRPRQAEDVTIPKGHTLPV
jgi:hypothetical protein